MAVKYKPIGAGEDYKPWEDLKAATHLQFFPENIEYSARRKLWEIRQTKAVRDYVREFSAHMRDIWDMGTKTNYSHSWKV